MLFVGLQGRDSKAQAIGLGSSYSFVGNLANLRGKIRVASDRNHQSAIIRRMSNFIPKKQADELPIIDTSAAVAPPRPPRLRWSRRTRRLVGFLVVLVAGHFGLMGIKHYHEWAWRNEKRVLRSLDKSRYHTTVTRQVVPYWLCNEPRHGERVVEVRYSSGGWLVPGYHPDDDLLNRKSVWVTRGNGGMVAHLSEYPPPSSDEIRRLTSNLGSLQRITFGDEVLYPRE